MALRARKPVVTETRFKAVVYANRGVGKTHFCCSFPDAYYIDSEGISAYPHFIEMLDSNKSMLVSLHEMSEIIKEIKELLSTRHTYKTVVIDSITFPFHLLANMEAERLSKKKDGRTGEGTEFGANLAKAKRQVFELGMLLTRLDMNVIVTAHEKTRYEKNEEVGKSSDVNDKLEYALGTVLHLRKTGEFVRAMVEKSRYPELKTGELIEFNNGYETMCSRLGKELFAREVKPEDLATEEQIVEFDRLIKLLNIAEEIQNKWFASERASSKDQLDKVAIDKYITAMKNRINKGEEK